MKQIDYLKEKIIETFYYVDISTSSEDENQYYLFFQKDLSAQRINIMSCTTEEDILSCLQNLNQQFLHYWDRMVYDLESPFTLVMNQLYFDCHLNAPDVWLSQLNEDYKQKKSLHFFDLLKKGRKLIQRKNTSSEYDFDEVSDFCFYLINKYNLRSINLTLIKPHQAMTYLKRLDNNLTQMCEAMGMSYDVVGIHKTIGFVAGAHMEAFYRPDKKIISVGLKHMDKITLLHEWIHAVDYYVGNLFSEGNCVSKIEESVFHETEEHYQSFLSIKHIVQTISSEKKQNIVINDIRQALLKEGTSKFFSELLGDDFYLLNEEKKQHLHSAEAFRLVNNYLSNPTVETEQENLINFVFTHLDDLCANLAKVEHCILKPNEQLLSLKIFFNSANKNILGKESFYHLTSRLSMFSFNIDAWISNKTNNIADFIQKPIHPRVFKNFQFNDYLIQPTELLARYFESQVFPVSTLISNVMGAIFAQPIYKVGIDKDFTENKNKMITHIFGKDKIVNHIKKSRSTNQNDVPNFTL